MLRDAFELRASLRVCLCIGGRRKKRQRDRGRSRVTTRDTQKHPKRKCTQTLGPCAARCLRRRACRKTELVARGRDAAQTTAQRARKTLRVGDVEVRRPLDSPAPPSSPPSADLRDPPPPPAASASGSSWRGRSPRPSSRSPVAPARAPPAGSTRGSPQLYIYSSFRNFVGRAPNAIAKRNSVGGGFRPATWFTSRSPWGNSTF